MSAGRVMGRAVVGVGFALLVGCSDTSTESAAGATDAPVDDVGGFDVVDPDVATDGGESDAADDATDPDAPPRPVTPDDLCRSDADCTAGERCRFVDPAAPVGLCTTGCASDADCPPGWGCFEFIERSGDTVRVCVSEQLCLDEDEDGYGWGDDCRGLDCDDARPDVRPDADEVCNGRDDDCDGVVDGVTVDDGAPCVTGIGGACEAGLSACVGGVVSCAATAAVDEVCNGVDDDCDGVADEGLACAGEPCCFDDVCDGVCAGSLTDDTGACARPAAYGDEVCDDLDNDCDGEVDEGLERRALYPDVDGDGYGDETADPFVTCTSPDGFVDNADDCDDGSADVGPHVEQVVANGVDDSCSGFELCYVDEDGDGVRRFSWFITSSDLDCDDPPEAGADMPCCDCYDSDPDRTGDPDEICDAVDNDCDGEVDEGLPLVDLYPDRDGDGFGDATAGPFRGCDGLDGFAANNGDCDDRSRGVNPGAGEQIGNGRDDNCDGTELCFSDADDDGVVLASFLGHTVSEDLDCDDPGEGRNPSISPDTCCDCDDENPDVGAGVPEVCDGVDNDCNGLVDEQTRSWCCCVGGRCYEPGDIEPMFETCRAGERICLPGEGAVEVASCD